MEKPFFFAVQCLGFGLLNTVSGFPIDFSSVGTEEPNPLWLTNYFLTAVGFLLAVIGVIFGCVCCRNSKGFKEFTNNSGSHSSPRPEGFVNPTSTSELTIFPPAGINSNQICRFEPLPDIKPQAPNLRPAAFSYSEQEISSQDWFAELHNNFPRNQLKYVQEYGRGWFGRVVEGEAQNITPKEKLTKVMVKILHEDATPTDQMYFLHEVKFYRDLKHPNILRLLGRCLETEPFLIILECYPNGDLKSFLSQNLASARALAEQGVTLKMCSNITSGLQYMHENKFIHIDLAARNCLVGPDLTVKIGDYGNSIEIFKSDYYCAGSVALPVRWCAPETLKCTDVTIETREVTPPANIWSLAVVFWEICEFCKLPYAELNDDQVIVRVLGEKNYFLEKPNMFCLHKDELYRLMKLCWNSPVQRPTAAQINAILDNLISSGKVTQQKVQIDSKRISQDFEQRWQNLKPNYIPKRDNAIEVEYNANCNILSPKLSNAKVQDSSLVDSPLGLFMSTVGAGVESPRVCLKSEKPKKTSFEAVDDSGMRSENSGRKLVEGQPEENFDFEYNKEVTPPEILSPNQKFKQPEVDSWLKGVEINNEEDETFVRNISEAIRDLDAALAMEKTSSSEENSGKSSHQNSPGKNVKEGNEPAVDFKLGSDTSSFMNFTPKSFELSSLQNTEQPQSLNFAEGYMTDKTNEFDENYGQGSLIMPMIDESKENFKVFDDSLKEGDSFLGTQSRNSSDTDDEVWRKRIERGEISEKVKEKSKSIANLMILTHIDASDESDLDLDKSFDRSVNRNSFLRRSGSFAKSSLSSNNFGSENDITFTVLEDDFKESLKKLSNNHKEHGHFDSLGMILPTAARRENVWENLFRETGGGERTMPETDVNTKKESDKTQTVKESPNPDSSNNFLGNVASEKLIDNKLNQGDKDDGASSILDDLEDRSKMDDISEKLCDINTDNCSNSSKRNSSHIKDKEEKNSAASNTNQGVLGRVAPTIPNKAENASVDTSVHDDEAQFHALERRITKVKEASAHLISKDKVNNEFSPFRVEKTINDTESTAEKHPTDSEVGNVSHIENPNELDILESVVLGEIPVEKEKAQLVVQRIETKSDPQTKTSETIVCEVNNSQVPNTLNKHEDVLYAHEDSEKVQQIKETDFPDIKKMDSVNLSKVSAVPLQVEGVLDLISHDESPNKEIREQIDVDTIAPNNLVLEEISQRGDAQTDKESVGVASLTLNSKVVAACSRNDPYQCTKNTTTESQVKTSLINSSACDSIDDLIFEKEDKLQIKNLVVPVCEIENGCSTKDLEKDETSEKTVNDGENEIAEVLIDEKLNEQLNIFERGNDTQTLPSVPTTMEKQNEKQLVTVNEEVIESQDKTLTMTVPVSQKGNESNAFSTPDKPTVQEIVNAPSMEPSGKNPLKNYSGVPETGSNRVFVYEFQTEASKTVPISCKSAHESLTRNAEILTQEKLHVPSKQSPETKLGTVNDLKNNISVTTEVPICHRMDKYEVEKGMEPKTTDCETGSDSIKITPDSQIGTLQPSTTVCETVSDNLTKTSKTTPPICENVIDYKDEISKTNPIDFEATTESEFLKTKATVSETVSEAKINFSETHSVISETADSSNTEKSTIETPPPKDINDSVCQRSETTDWAIVNSKDKISDTTVNMSQIENDSKTESSMTVDSTVSGVDYHINSTETPTVPVYDILGDSQTETFSVKPSASETKESKPKLPFGTFFNKSQVETVENNSTALETKKDAAAEITESTVTVNKKENETVNDNVKDSKTKILEAFGVLICDTIEGSPSKSSTTKASETKLSACEKANGSATETPETRSKVCEMNYNLPPLPEIMITEEKQILDKMPEEAFEQIITKPRPFKFVLKDTSFVPQITITEEPEEEEDLDEGDEENFEFETQSVKPFKFVLKDEPLERSEVTLSSGELEKKSYPFLIDKYVGNEKDGTNGLTKENGSVIIGACEDYTLDYFKGLKTTSGDIEREGEANQNLEKIIEDMRAKEDNLDVWDKHLEKALTQQLTDFDDVSFKSFGPEVEEASKVSTVDTMFVCPLHKITDFIESEKVHTEKVEEPIHINRMTSLTGIASEEEYDNFKLRTPDDERSSDSGFRDKGSLSESVEDACEGKYNLEDIEAELEEAYVKGAFGNCEIEKEQPKDVKASSKNFEYEESKFYEDENKNEEDFSDIDGEIEFWHNKETSDYYPEISEFNPNTSQGWYLHPPDDSVTFDRNVSEDVVQALRNELRENLPVPTRSFDEFNDTFYESDFEDTKRDFNIQYITDFAVPLSPIIEEQDSSLSETTKKNIKNSLLDGSKVKKNTIHLMESVKSIDTKTFMQYLDYMIENEGRDIDEMEEVDEIPEKEIDKSPLIIAPPDKTNHEGFEEAIKDALGIDSVSGSESISEAEQNCALLLEDLESGCKSKVVKETKTEDDVLVVNIDTNEMTLLESPKPKPYMAFLDEDHRDDMLEVVTDNSENEGLIFTPELLSPDRDRSLSESNGTRTGDALSEITLSSPDLVPDCFSTSVHEIVRNNEANEIIDELKSSGIMEATKTDKPQPENNSSLPLITMKPSVQTDVFLSNEQKYASEFQLEIQKSKESEENFNKPETDDLYEMSTSFMGDDDGGDDEEYSNSGESPKKQKMAPPNDRKSEKKDIAEDSYTPDWESDSSEAEEEMSSSSGEFIWKDGDKESKVKAVQATDCDVETSLYEKSQSDHSAVELNNDVNQSKENAERQQNGEGDEEDDDDDNESSTGSSASITDFVPSAWNSQATPSRSAIKSPEKKSDQQQKKNVWFKKQKYHCVYEYPREPSDTEDADNSSFNPFSYEKTSAETPNKHFIYGVNTVELPNKHFPYGISNVIDFSSFTDWDVLEEDGDLSLTDTDSDNGVGKSDPNAKESPFNFYNLSPFDYDFNSAGLLNDESEFFVSSSSRPFQGSSTSQFFPGNNQIAVFNEINNSKNLKSDVSETSENSVVDGKDYTTPDSGLEDSANVTPMDSKTDEIKQDGLLPKGETTTDPKDGILNIGDNFKFNFNPEVVDENIKKDCVEESNSSPNGLSTSTSNSPSSPLSPGGLGELRHARDRLRLNLPLNHNAELGAVIKKRIDQSSLKL